MFLIKILAILEQFSLAHVSFLGSYPRSVIKNEIQKIFLAKTLRVNKLAMKKFLTNLSFGVDFKL